MTSMPTDQGRGSSSAAEQSQRRYYCRGCGRPLPPGLRSHFHRECLRIDKRERVREQRQREKAQLEALLHKQRCLNCGARYGDQRSNGAAKASCEASQPTEVRERMME